MNIYYDHGIVIKHKKCSLLIDPIGFPSFKPDVIMISHAHRDHYNLKVLKSFPETLKLMSPVTHFFLDKNSILTNVVEIVADQEIHFDNFIVKAYEAGHILGSLQYEIVLGDKRIVYTGDFNLQARLILNPGKIVKADILIIESTYGHPHYNFPERSSVYKQVLEYCKQLIDLGYKVNVLGRPLGTAQELTTLFSYSSFNLYPVVHPVIARINKVYENYGENLGTYRILTSESKEVKDNPLIMPLKRKNYKENSSLVCTGWAMVMHKRGYIPLSSHADFKQLIEYTRKSSPEKVYTIYGFTNTLADFLKDEYSFDAMPLR